MNPNFRGLYAILTASLTEDMAAIDTEDIRRQSEFCVLGGAHGIVAPVNATEHSMLTFEERKTVVRHMVEQVAGRIPTVVGVQGPCTEIAVAHAKYAKEFGADAVIAMGPYITQISDMEYLKNYFGAIADACGLPVMLQNHDHAGQIPLTVAQVGELIKSVPAIQYVKEETPDSNHVIGAMTEQYKAFPDFKGVFGGKGSRFMIEEYYRGACGNMPACDIPDLSAKLWDLLDAGKADEARDWFWKIYPVIEMEADYKFRLYKEVLAYRGIVKNTRWRTPGGTMDAHDRENFVAAMKKVEPYFTVHADDIKL